MCSTVFYMQILSYHYVIRNSLFNNLLLLFAHIFYLFLHNRAYLFVLFLPYTNGMVGKRKGLPTHLIDTAPPATPEYQYLHNCINFSFFIVTNKSFCPCTAQFYCANIPIATYILSHVLMLMTVTYPLCTILYLFLPIVSKLICLLHTRTLKIIHITISYLSTYYFINFLHTNGPYVQT